MWCRCAVESTAYENLFVGFVVLSAYIYPSFKVKLKIIITMLVVIKIENERRLSKIIIIVYKKLNTVHTIALQGVPMTKSQA